MGTITRGLLTGGMLAGLFGAAHGLSITDAYTPESTVVLRTGATYSYQHDLLKHGFDPAADTLTGATLTLGISGPGGQKLRVTFAGAGSFEGSLNELLGEGWGAVVPLDELQREGLLNVALVKGGGLGSRFIFTESILVAQWAGGGGAGNGSADILSEHFRPIREPNVLALVGLGLLGAFAIQHADIRGWLQPVRIPEVQRTAGLRLIRSRRLFAAVLPAAVSRS